MPTDRAASSSDDLDLARRISRRLRGQAAGPGVPGPAYIRFSAAAFTSRIETASPFGPAVWNEMLDRCNRESSAELSFVMDAQGLVVASRGSLDPALVEGIGARLLIAFEQADQMAELGAATQSIAIEIGRRWLTGFRVRRGEDRSFTVGVLGPRVVSRDTREALDQMMARG
ncbi:MAG: hypothetical protein QM820_57335 [Minicystis sp.]